MYTLVRRALRATEILLRADSPRVRDELDDLRTVLEREYETIRPAGQTLTTEISAAYTRDTEVRDTKESIVKHLEALYATRVRADDIERSALGLDTVGLGTDGTATPTPTPTATPTPAPEVGEYRGGDGDWTAFAHDSRRSRYNPGTRVPDSAPTVAWEVPAAHPPVVADGTVYLLREESVVALDAATGQQRWKSVPENLGFYGAFGPLTVADGTVYVGTTYRGIAIDAADGTERWHYGVGDADDVYAPMVVDDLVTFVSSGTLLALDPADGSERWTAGSVFDPVADGLGSVAGDAVLARSRGSTFETIQARAVADGTKRWEYTTPSTYLHEPPTVHGDGIYLADESGVRALDAADGTQRWATDLHGGGTALAAADGRLFVRTGSGTVQALDAADGSRRWAADAVGDAGPVLADGDVLVGGDRLVAVDAYTGDRRWAADVAAGGSVVAAGDRLYALGDGTLTAMAPK